MGKMKKAVRSKRIMFDNLKLNKAVLEIRYSKGYLYWDVCGRSLLEINKLSGEKIDFVRLSTEECILRLLEYPTAQATFGVKHMTVSATELRNLKLFKDNAPVILDVVKGNLKVEEISRAGFRLYYVVGTETYEEARRFVGELGLASVNAGRFKGFGTELRTEANVEVSSSEGGVRIQVSAVKRADCDDQAAQFNEYSPRYAVMVDFDFYRETVKMDEFNVGEFIHRAEKKVKDHIDQIVNK